MLVVCAWPAECSLAGSSPSRETLKFIEYVRAWADRAGISICLPFEPVTRTSTITGEQQELLRTPLLCLVCYINGQLAAVSPHTDDAQTHSAMGALENQTPSEHSNRRVQSSRTSTIDRCVHHAEGTNLSLIELA